MQSLISTPSAIRRHARSNWLALSLIALALLLGTNSHALVAQPHAADAASKCPGCMPGHPGPELPDLTAMLRASAEAHTEALHTHLRETLPAYFAEHEGWGELGQGEHTLRQLRQHLEALREWDGWRHRHSGFRFDAALNLDTLRVTVRHDGHFALLVQDCDSRYLAGHSHEQRLLISDSLQQLEYQEALRIMLAAHAWVSAKLEADGGTDGFDASGYRIDLMAQQDNEIAAAMQPSLPVPVTSAPQSGMHVYIYAVDNWGFLMGAEDGGYGLSHERTFSVRVPRDLLVCPEPVQPRQ